MLADKLHPRSNHCGPPLVPPTHPNMESSSLKTDKVAPLSMKPPSPGLRLSMSTVTCSSLDQVALAGSRSCRPLEAWIKTAGLLVRLGLLANKQKGEKKKQMNNKQTNRNTPVCVRASLCYQRRTDVVDNNEISGDRIIAVK